MKKRVVEMVKGNPHESKGVKTPLVFLKNVGDQALAGENTIIEKKKNGIIGTSGKFHNFPRISVR